MRIIAPALLAAAVVAILMLPPIAAQEPNPRPCTTAADTVQAPHALRVAAEHADNLLDKFRHKHDAHPTPTNTC
ncbi:hypothetical protein [Embleya sp. NPDC059237]|uniref:hypothetical protein n=1 Tax=Embleya sp. NPDC059237 TaxID=3346784 RepID=UPI0036A9DC88